MRSRLALLAAAVLFAAACRTLPPPPPPPPTYPPAVAGTETLDVKIQLMPEPAQVHSTLKVLPPLPLFKRTATNSLEFWSQINAAAAWQRIGIGNFRSADGNPIPNVTVSGSCDPLKGKSPANTDACKITFDGPATGQAATVKFDVLLYTQEGDTTPALVVDPVLVIKGG